jgi:hypothetical protein
LTRASSGAVEEEKEVVASFVEEEDDDRRRRVRIAWPRGCTDRCIQAMANGAEARPVDDASIAVNMITRGNRRGIQTDFLAGGRRVDSTVLVDLTVFCMI